MKRYWHLIAVGVGLIYLASGIVMWPEVNYLHLAIGGGLVLLGGFRIIGRFMPPTR